ncbi:unnamed protein product, partial [marine sediment metagenome]
MAGWLNLNIKMIDIINGEITLDITNLILGSYPYKIVLNEKTTTEGIFNYCQGAQVFMSDKSKEQLTTLISPVRRFERDAWNNVTKQTDTLGNQTSRTYNYNNKVLTEVLPLITASNEHGQNYNTPTETYAYNARGYQIGIRDANGHVIAQRTDATGKSIATVLADGICEEKRLYDALGRMTWMQDSRGEIWYRNYNHLNKVIQITPP